MSDLQTKFEAAVANSKKLTERPDNTTLLKIYALYKQASTGEVIPVDEAVLDLAFELRRTATARLALADCLIAATAAHHRAILVHRDSHFAALPEGRPKQETLPSKVLSP